MNSAAWVSSAIALIALILSIYNNSKRETHQVARMMQKLESISDDVRDVKNDLTNMRTSIQDNHDRILRLEMSLQTAWKRIDELKGDSYGK